MKLDVPPPPRGDELLPLIAAVAEIGPKQLALLSRLAPMSEHMTQCMLNVDRLKLIGRLAAGMLDSEDAHSLSESETTLLLMAGVFGMLRSGASPAEIKEVLLRGLSHKAASDFLRRASAGAKP